MDLKMARQDSYNTIAVSVLHNFFYRYTFVE